MFTAYTSFSDTAESSNNILKILVKMTAYPQVSMILTNPGYQSAIVTYICNTFDKKGKHTPTSVVLSYSVSVIYPQTNPSIICI